MPSTGRRITICPIEATNNYGELTRFEVDAATTSLRDVVERIHADPMLHCKQVRVGTRLLTYEDDVTGDPIDMFSPAVALEPLAAIVPHLLPCAAANGLTEFAEGQEMWLVVDGCATDSDAIRHIGSELLFSRFDSIARRFDAMSMQKENAALRAMIEAIGLMCAQFAPSAAASALEVALEDSKTNVAGCLLGLIPSTHSADGSGLLHRAAAGGHSNTARALVKERGVDIEAKDIDGCSPLHFAARYGHADTARILVKELGAKVTSEDKNGAIALHTAASAGHVGVVRISVKELGADISANDSDGAAPIHLAAKNGCADVVSVCVTELGADVHSKDNKGFTPLHTAASHGQLGVARLLVNNLESDVHAKAHDGSTPLHAAAKEGQSFAARPS